MDSFTPEQEADFFGKYIIKKSPNEYVKQQYVKALQNSASQIQISDKKIAEFLYRNQWSLGCIDSGLALLTPHSEIRKRIYIIFALLESSPEYVDYFLPKKRNLFYLFILFFVGVRAIVKSLIGVLLIKIIV